MCQVCLCAYDSEAQTESHGGGDEDIFFYPTFFSWHGWDGSGQAIAGSAKLGSMIRIVGVFIGLRV